MLIPILFPFFINSGKNKREKEVEKHHKEVMQFYECTNDQLLIPDLVSYSTQEILTKQYGLKSIDYRSNSANGMQLYCYEFSELTTTNYDKLRKYMTIYPKAISGYTMGSSNNKVYYSYNKEFIYQVIIELENNKKPL